MKVTTFDGDEPCVEAELLSAPSATGLCKVKIGERVLARHVARVVPIDDEAKQLLGKTPKPGGQHGSDASSTEVAGETKPA